MILASLKTGLTKAIRNWQLALIQVLTSMVFAIPIAIPFVSTVTQTTLFRPAGTRMVSDTIDPIWLIDFANEQFAGTSLTAFSAQVIVTFLAMAFGFLLANVAIAGGVIEALVKEDRHFSLRIFFTGIGNHLWPFLRLWIISLAIYGAIFFVFLIVMAVIDGYQERAVAEGPVVLSKWLATLCLAGTFALVNMIFTYARISTVVHGASSMIRETGFAIRFVAQNLIKTSAVYVTVLVAGFAVFGFFEGLRGLIGQNSLGMAMLAWIVGQLAIAGRMWARVASYSAGLEVYRASTRPNHLEPTIINLTPEFETAVESQSSL